jgi:hypothetical protein
VNENTRTAVQTFVATMKLTNLWSLCDEIGVFAGSNLSAALVKLKYKTIPSLLNSNFVEADYSEATGLLGNGTTKYLDTGYVAYNSLPDTCHLSFYLREASATAGNRVFVAVLGNGATDQFALFSNSGNNDVTGRLGNLTAASQSGAPIAAFYQTSRQSLTDLRLYRNGAQMGSPIATAVTLNKPAYSFYLWAYNNSGLAGGRLDKRGCFYSIGKSMDPEQSSNFYKIVQALQTALGRQV